MNGTFLWPGAFCGTYGEFPLQELSEPERDRTTPLDRCLWDCHLWMVKGKSLHTCMGVYSNQHKRRRKIHWKSKPQLTSTWPQTPVTHTQNIQIRAPSVTVKCDGLYINGSSNYSPKIDNFPPHYWTLQVRGSFRAAGDRRLLFKDASAVLRQRQLKCEIPLSHPVTDLLRREQQLLN